MVSFKIKKYGILVIWKKIDNMLLIFFEYVEKVMIMEQLGNK